MKYMPYDAVKYLDFVDTLCSCLWQVFPSHEPSYDARAMTTNGNFRYTPFAYEGHVETLKVVTDSCLSEARVPDFNGEKKGMT